jgi:ElaA protein
MNTTIKPFSELSTDELYNLLQLRSEIFVVEQQCIYNDLDGLDRQAAHLMMQEDGIMVATARILPSGTRFPQVSIGRVVVHQAYRGRELGKTVMLEAIRFATQTYQATEIKISAQLYLKRFYGDLGFTTITGIYDEDGIPHIGMIYSP